jgi:ABC-type Mn2+/Zn2+ transport system ATPase subunit
LVISKNEKVLVLDEPMKAVSVDLREDVYSILKTLSTEMGLQVIMTSHDEYAKAIADKIFEFTLIGGETNAT